MTDQRHFLLDVTRLVAKSWTNRRPTGIDRVCKAYLLHFRSRALAVVQHRGIHRVLTAQQSDTLFNLLVARHSLFRWNLTRFMPQVLNTQMAPRDCAGKTYLNVGHTDFDLPTHWQWLGSMGLKSAYLIHDLIPINHPELTSEHAVRRHLARVQMAVSNADGIITNSRATTDDLKQFVAQSNLDVPPVLEAHLGTDHIAEVSPKRQIDGPYFVYVSTIEARKNHLLLLRAWKRLTRKFGERAPKLLLIGQWGFQADLVRNMISREQELVQSIIVINQCADAEMARWVQSAQAVLIPSMAEGFGLPLAEAMALGTPAIVSDLQCFREIGGNIPDFISPSDAIGWETAIAEFINDPAKANRQRALLAQHHPTSWSMHFKLVENWVTNLPARHVTHLEVEHSPHQRQRFSPRRSQKEAR